jgi:hypothetical protein
MNVKHNFSRFSLSVLCIQQRRAWNKGSGFLSFRHLQLYEKGDGNFNALSEHTHRHSPRLSVRKEMLLSELSQPSLWRRALKYTKLRRESP